MRLGSIRRPASGWERPIRATRARPKDTDDYGEAPFHLSFRLAPADTGAARANGRRGFSRDRAVLLAQSLRLPLQGRNSGAGASLERPPSHARIVACADEPRPGTDARGRIAAFALRGRARAAGGSDGRVTAGDRRRR